MGDRGRTFDYALGSEGPKWAADLVARCAAAAVADLTELSEELPEWRASRELGRLRTEGLAVDLALSLAEITDERAGSPLTPVRALSAPEAPVETPEKVPPSGREKKVSELKPAVPGATLWSQESPW